MDRQENRRPVLFVAMISERGATLWLTYRQIEGPEVDLHPDRVALIERYARERQVSIADVTMLARLVTSFTDVVEFSDLVEDKCRGVLPDAGTKGLMQALRSATQDLHRIWKEDGSL